MTSKGMFISFMYNLYYEFGCLLNVIFHIFTLKDWLSDSLNLLLLHNFMHTSKVNLLMDRNVIGAFIVKVIRAEIVTTKFNLLKTSKRMANDVVMTSYRRQCDVKTSRRL